MMMMKCWELLPENRPSFKELHENTSRYIEHIAGYLEMGFNPFAGMGFTMTEEVQASAGRMNNEEDKNQIESPVIQDTPISGEPSAEDGTFTNTND